MIKAIDRRGFIKGASISALGLAGAGLLASCETQANAAGESFSYDQTVAWDGEYDVVVIGFGGAGAVAAKTAAEEGASVLLVEKAAKGDEGGNTRFCTQMFAYGNEDEEATKAYYRALGGDMPVADDVLEAYAGGIARLFDTYSESYGLDKAEFVNFPYPAEYPEFEGSDKITMATLHEGSADAYMWQIQHDAVVALSDKIDVWYQSPAHQLIQDPQSKTIVGVEVDRKGKTVAVKAKNGVVLTCGGFENNPDMVKDYLGMGKYAPLGTLNNTGDGIKMATAVGADLWHMHSVETMHILGGLSYVTEEGMRGQMVSYQDGFMGGSVMLVGTDGYRYLREDELPRHGHIYHNGIWMTIRHPEKSFLIYDQAKATELAAAGKVPEAFLDQAVSAATITELAQTIGTKEGVLEQTVDDYNSFADAGYDPALQRSAESMQALGEGPYYALEVIPDILNTQGGPRRNGNAEVIGVNGIPLPHLYAAGECGGVASNMYQGGGNMADNMIFGQIAGRNAAMPKDELPAFAAVEIESNVQFVPGKESDL